jgi:hypothetical protein
MVDLAEKVARAMFAVVKRDSDISFDEVAPIREAYIAGAEAAIEATGVRELVEALERIKDMQGPGTSDQNLAMKRVAREVLAKHGEMK